MPLMSGIFVAMVTPFTDDQEIDYKRTAKLLDHLMASDIAGVFILGTNGEAYLLSAEEKIVFSSFVINYVNHHIKVLVGTGLMVRLKRLISVSALLHWSQMPCHLLVRTLWRLHKMN